MQRYNKRQRDASVLIVFPPQLATRSLTFPSGVNGIYFVAANPARQGRGAAREARCNSIHRSTTQTHAHQTVRGIWRDQFQFMFCSKR